MSEMLPRVGELLVSRRGFMGWRAGALLLLFCLSCSSGPTTAAQSPQGKAPVEFSFASVGGEPITDESFRGRVTVILFATTFDLPSQAQAKRLEDIFRTRAPRINALLVILEAPRYVDLARSYRRVLGLHYPVAMADAETRSGRGPFGDVRAVPSWVILDARGRVTFAGSGELEPARLLELIEKAQ